MRVMLYTGKGGVGKTTLAAATALRAARLGQRTIVLSTDPAHSLADAFDQPLGPEPTPIAPNLWGQETDVYYNLAHWWGSVQAWLKTILAWRGVDELMAEEMAVVPGMEELANLLWVRHHAQEGQYDAIIVDCAPTGHTLRLLSFPDAAGWWMRRLLPIHRQAARILRPGIRLVSDFPLPSEDVYKVGQELIDQLAELHTLLANADVTSVRLVVNAERMAVKEAQRTFTYLSLYGYATDAVLCNRLIPPGVEERYLEAWKELQAEHLRFIEECFSPLPILTAPFLPQEVVGPAHLEELAQALFQGRDPLEFFFRGQLQHLAQEDGGYVLTLTLPFVTKEEVTVVRHGEELVLRAAGYKRHVLLPRVLRGLATTGARWEEGRLRITFARDRG